VVYVTTLSVVQTICGRMRQWPNLRWYRGTSLDELKNITKALSQDSKCPGRDSRSLEYMSEESRLSQLGWWLWRILFFGMWGRVVKYMFTAASEEHAASIFMAEE
jgi:hypothetical protein